MLTRGTFSWPGRIATFLLLGATLACPKRPPPTLPAADTRPARDAATPLDTGSARDAASPPAPLFGAALVAGLPEQVRPVVELPAEPELAARAATGEAAAAAKARALSDLAQILQPQWLPADLAAHAYAIPDLAPPYGDTASRVVRIRADGSLVAYTPAGFAELTPEQRDAQKPLPAELRLDAVVARYQVGATHIHMVQTIGRLWLAIKPGDTAPGVGQAALVDRARRTTEQYLQHADRITALAFDPAAYAPTPFGMQGDSNPMRFAERFGPDVDWTGMLRWSTDGDTVVYAIAKGSGGRVRATPERTDWF